MSEEYVFCTLGNDPHKFNRLVKLACAITQFHGIKLKLQSGVNVYGDCHGEQLGFVSRTQFNELVANSKYVICHAGAGTLGQVKSYRKRSIVVPRLVMFAEHVNDHQLEIAKLYSEEQRIFLPSDYMSKEINVANCTKDFISFDFNFLETRASESLNAVVMRQIDEWLYEAT